MKQLSINHISAASIRANRKTYLSLAVGIVLAVLLATVMTLCAFGLIKALERKAVQIVGWTDCILLDEPDITDESLRQSGLFDRIGHQFVAASVTDSNVYLGWLDEAGQDVLCRAPAEGRMPEQRVIASGLPLRRASRQMPMGVLRDTALLRKAGSFRSKRSFHATKLIAVRQLRIHPWRQIGAALLVAATLLCAAVIGEASYDVMDDHTRSRPVAFSLTNQKATFSNVPFSVVRPENQLSEQDVAQVRSLPLVDYANLEAETKVNMLLYGEVPDYFLPFTGRTLGQGTDGENTWVYNIFGGGSGLNYLSFSPDDPEPTLSPNARPHGGPGARGQAGVLHALCHRSEPGGLYRPDRRGQGRSGSHRRRPAGAGLRADLSAFPAGGGCAHRRRLGRLGPRGVGGGI